MKPKQFFKPILFNAWKLTWRNKLLWFAGFFALFFSGVLSFQVVFQGVKALFQPTNWWISWQSWAGGISPWEIITGQFSIMTSDPKGWGIMVAVWAAILLVLLLMFTLSVYSMTILISAAKEWALEGKVSVILAIREAWFYFKGVFWAILLIHLVANVLLVLFSIPVIWLGVANASVLSSLLLYVFFMIFLIVAYMVSMMAMYTVMHIVIEEYPLSSAIVNAWKMFSKYWFVTLEMFLIQILIAVALVLLLLLVVSLVVIPVSIIVFILVSQGLIESVAFIPLLMFYILIISILLVGAAYSAFQLYGWSFLFMDIEKIRPQSRFAQFIEMHILAG